MAHLLFGGSNRPGLAALESALNLGHRATFLSTPGMMSFFGDAAARAILSRVTVLDVGSFKDVERLTRIVAQIHAENPVDAGLTVFEPAVQTFGEACARCGITATSNQAIAIARDKARCRDRLRELGIAQLPSRLVASTKEASAFAVEVGFPIILKPNNGLFSMLVRRVDNMEDIQTYFSELALNPGHLPTAVRENIDLGDRIVAERYVVGELHSVEVAMTTEGPHCLVLSRRKRDSTNDAIELGSTMPGTTDPVVTDRSYRYVVEILNALGFDRGVFHVEIILGDDGVPHLVEINPRLMGGTSPTLYNLVSGRDVFADLVRVHLDEPIAPVLAFEHAVASRVIGAACDWTVRDDLPQDWIEALAPHMAFHDVRIASGVALPRMTHNYNSLGQFQVRAGSPQEADRKANALLDRISEITGVPLCR